MVGFNEPVVIPMQAVTVWTVGDGFTPTIQSITTDPTTNVATIHFSDAFRDDRLTLVIDYSVTDLSGNELDGEITNPEVALMPSGDGFRGGQAVFRFNILQGDANRDGAVNTSDGDQVQAALGTTVGDPSFDPNSDLNGDGVVNILDVGIFRLAEGRTIPVVGTSPAVVDISPAPFTPLASDFGDVTLIFDQAVSPNRFSPHTAYVIDDLGVLHVPIGATLAPDGLSATYSLTSFLPKCGHYSVNVSNSLSSVSGALLTRPVPVPELSGMFPPAAPTLDPHETITQADSVTVSGSIATGGFVEIALPSSVFTAPVTNGVFSTEVPVQANEVNHIFFTAISDCGGVRGTPITTTITNDNQPPNLFIDYPPAGADLTVTTTDVAGRVSDLLSGFMGLSVVVNGIAAEVDVGIGTNGTFLAQGVPLNLGTPTIITAIATDELGNQTSRDITVQHVEIPPDSPRMVVLSGNSQEAVIHSLLPAPVIIKVTNADGTPFPNKVVTFKVVRSDGRLTTNGVGEGTMTLQVHTAANGEAGAFWRLGGDAGCGNNRIEVTSTSIAGTVGFCASSVPAPAAQINIGSGHNQRAEVGGPTPEPLRAWVSDSCNGVPNVPVTFTVIEGGGKVNGLDAVTVNTSNTGHVNVDLTLGPNAGSNIVEVNFPNNTTAPATFVVVGLERDDSLPTSFSGLILNNAGQPVGGAPCFLIIGSSPAVQTVSSANGQFHFDNLSGAGPGHLFVNGLQATTVDGQPIQTGSLPSLNFQTLLIPNVENMLSTHVLLPLLDPVNATAFDNTQDAELTVEGMEGLKMIVKAGSMTRADGTVPSPANPETLMLNQVHSDKIPMPMPDGVSPPFAWTLQPAGARFDPPVEIEMPNMSGLAPGAVMYFLSFNHDTMRFEIVASGHVSDDGSMLVTDPGAGITTAGWGGFCPPYPETGDVVRRRIHSIGVWSSAKGIVNDITIEAGQGVCLEIASLSATVFGLTIRDVSSLPLEPRPGIEIRSFFIGSFQTRKECFGIFGPEPMSRRFQLVLPLNAVAAYSYTITSTWVPGDPPNPPQLTAATSAVQSTLSQFRLDDAWVVSVSGRSTPVGPDGNFRLTNIPANGVLARLSGKLMADAGNRYVASVVFFNIIGQGTVTINQGGILISDTAFPSPTHLSTSVETSVLEPAMQTRVIVSGLMSDGSEMALQSLKDGTRYTSTNQSVAMANEDGIITGFGRGIAFITVNNQGVTAVQRIDVVEMTASTIVEGFVTLDGTPVAGAMVDTNFGGSASSDPTGFFSISLPAVPPDSSITASALRIQTGDSFRGTSVTSPVVADGITDAGVIALSQIVSGPLFSGLELELGDFPVSVAIGDLDGDGINDLVVGDGSTVDVSVLLGTGRGKFASRVTYNSGIGLTYVAVGDLDGDGDNDLAVAGSNARVSVLLNNGDGTFAPRVMYTVGSASSSVSIGDLDGDGDNDLAVSNELSDSVSVLLNNGDGTFAVQVTYGVGSFPVSVAIGDMDGDGDNDLAVSNELSNNISVLLNNGDGTFAVHITYGVGSFPVSVAIGDMDGDGDNDLAVVNRGNNNVSVLLNNGDGTFAVHLTYDVGFLPKLVAVGDLDGDGDNDLTVANFDSANVSVLLNIGDGSFAAHLTYAAGSRPGSMAVGDLDGDGIDDVVVGSVGIGGIIPAVSVLLNAGDGTLGSMMFAVGNNPQSVAVGDLDGDGNNDLVVANHQNNNVSVLLNIGDGSFAVQVTYGVGFSPFSVTIGDLDGDGDNDLAVANRNSGTVSVLLNTGDGMFAAHVTYHVGSLPRSVVIGDLDGDGDNDVAVANRGSDNISVLLNNGDGTFLPDVTYAVGSRPWSLAIGDLDGDGINDLAVTNESSANVAVLLNAGDGTFVPSMTYAVGSTPVSVAIGDLDGDGDNDLVVANRDNNNVSVLLNIGDGSFAPHLTYRVGLWPISVAVGDLDGDGHSDLVVGNQRDWDVSVLLNTGDGTFAPHVTFSAGQGLISVAVGDLDRDGDSDLAVANSIGDTVSVLLNRTIRTQP